MARKRIQMPTHVSVASSDSARFRKCRVLRGIPTRDRADVRTTGRLAKISTEEIARRFELFMSTVKTETWTPKNL